MVRTLLFLLIAALLAAPGCNKPSQTADAVEGIEHQLTADDGSELSEFVKKHRKTRKHKKTKPASFPPTRKEGLAALEEGRLLVEEAEFRAAEKELRIAAAAGVDGADTLLLKVRTEISAEDRIISAQKKLAARDLEGAKADLQRVPDGLILSDLARQMTAKIERQEEEARRELRDRATKKYAEAPDASEEEADAAEKAAEPEKAE